MPENKIKKRNQVFGACRRCLKVDWPATKVDWPATDWARNGREGKKGPSVMEMFCGYEIKNGQVALVFRTNLPNEVKYCKYR